MNYYSHNIGDYAQATGHLSLAEDAIYSRLLRRYYAEEQPIVDNLQQVFRWVGARTARASPTCSGAPGANAERRAAVARAAHGTRQVNSVRWLMSKLTADERRWNWARWTWSGATVGNMEAYLSEEEERRPVDHLQAMEVEAMHAALPQGDSQQGERN
ncbi:YdaU family protein [Achromobacter sp.]|uniref:YdaU family protein n=1 Tax=Achromobacter sp. TaxID=134375 RepID=UPI002F95BCC7